MRLTNARIIIIIIILNQLSSFLTPLCSESDAEITKGSPPVGWKSGLSSVKAFKRSLGAIDLSGFCTGSF